MLNYQRFAIAIVVVFCSLAVLAVTATNNADTILFAEIPWTLSSPPPVQSYQDINGQSSELLILGIVQPTLFINLYTGTPETPSPEPYLQTYTLDQYGKLIVIDYEEIFRENTRACGTCGPPAGSYIFADPLREDQLMPAPVKPLIGQSPFMEEA